MVWTPKRGMSKSFRTKRTLLKETSTVCGCLSEMFSAKPQSWYPNYIRLKCLVRGYFLYPEWLKPGQTVKATETVETVTKRSVGGLRIPCPILGVVNPSPSTLNMIFSGYFPILQRQFPAPEREQFDPKVGTFVGWFASNWKLPWQRNTEVPTKPTNPLSHYILTLLPIFLQISQVRIPKLSELPYDKMLFPRTWEKHQVNISERHFPQQLGWIKSLIPQKTDYRFEKYLERSWPAADRRTCDSISSSVF